MQKWRNRRPVFSTESGIFKKVHMVQYSWSSEKRLERETYELLKRLVDHMKELGFGPEDAEELLKNCRGVHGLTCT